MTFWQKLRYLLTGYCAHEWEWYHSIQREGYWQKCWRCPKCKVCTRSEQRGEIQYPD